MSPSRDDDEMDRATLENEFQRLVARADNDGDRATFDAELQRLVAQARDNGVHLQGAYTMRTPRHDVPDYTIEITEIAKNFTDDRRSRRASRWSHTPNTWNTGSPTDAVHRFLLSNLTHSRG